MTVIELISDIHTNYNKALLEEIKARLLSMFTMTNGRPIVRLYYDGQAKYCPIIVSIERFKGDYHFKATLGNKEYVEINSVENIPTSTMEDLLSADEYEFFDSNDNHYSIDYKDERLILF